MVRVPAGEFLMGAADSDRSANPNAKPQHSVYLDEFWIDQTEVTNAQYQRCVQAGKCSAPRLTDSRTRSSYYGDARFDNYPVIYVKWNDATAYCAWAGKRLPTEAEWEKAARGTDGRVYPWGDEWDYSKANIGGGDTTAVGSYPAGASPYGALDMAGNVYEFVADWFDGSYYKDSPSRNPTGPSSPTDRRVLRGGSWDLGKDYASTTYRFLVEPTWSLFATGFRCARGPLP